MTKLGTSHPVGGKTKGLEGLKTFGFSTAKKHSADEIHRRLCYRIEGAVVVTVKYSFVAEKRVVNLSNDNYRGLTRTKIFGKMSVIECFWRAFS